MTNTRNTPIETLETSVPVRVLGLAVRRGSGGSGARRGGDGLAKRLLFLEPARVTWVAERVRRGPWGLAGGGAGAPARARVRVPRERGRARELGAAASLEVPAGSVLELLTPGGGGHGRAR
jgi:N-methylhydantoinase B/oxoprolinase/acetone carboxylase alpha subunit